MTADLRSRARRSRALDVGRRLRLPVRAARFWVVQAGVLLVAFLDEVILDVLHVQLPFEIPRSTITSLLLVPVIYAALNFGVRGAVGTALWATVLMFPDWLFIAGVTTANAWEEIGNLAVLNAVAIIVGQRVEREAQARVRAEDALRASEIAKALYQSRTVLIFGEVDMKMAERVTAQLLAYAESEGDIRVIVNSPGGHVESGDTIHDMIRFVGNRVKMVGTGWVASAGAHIFLGAKKENRFCLPFTRFLLHQPLGGVRGQASDITIEAEEILKMRARLIKEISDETGQPLSKVEADTERNFWIGAEDAVKYGLAARVINRASDI